MPKPTLAQKRKAQLDELYEAIWKMKGIGDPHITDASATIDAVLYGENGVWYSEPGEIGVWDAPHLHHDKAHTKASGQEAERPNKVSLDHSGKPKHR